MQNITTRHINEAATTDELLDLMQDAASERGCELSDDSFAEQADFYREESKVAQVEVEQSASMEELAAMLDAAEQRWQEIES